MCVCVEDRNVDVECASASPIKSAGIVASFVCVGLGNAAEIILLVFQFASFCQMNFRVAIWLDTVH